MSLAGIVLRGGYVNEIWDRDGIGKFYNRYTLLLSGWWLSRGTIILQMRIDPVG